MIIKLGSSRLYNNKGNAYEHSINIYICNKNLSNNGSYNYSSRLVNFMLTKEQGSYRPYDLILLYVHLAYKFTYRLNESYFFVQKHRVIFTYHLLQCINSIAILFLFYTCVNNYISTHMF